MSNSFPVLGFDIGGTKIAVCLAMSDGKILASGRVDNRMRKPDEVLPDLVKEGKRLLKEAGITGDQLRAIGIDSPDRKSTRLNSSHSDRSRMPSSA